MTSLDAAGQLNPMEVNMLTKFRDITSRFATWNANIAQRIVAVLKPNSLNLYEKPNIQIALIFTR